MRRSRLVTALTALIVVSIGCSLENDVVSTPTPALQSIVNAPPYVCGLVPEPAFRLVSGIAEPSTENKTGNEESGECRAVDRTPRPLEVGWLQVGDGTSQEHLDFLLEDRRSLYMRHGGIILPTDLGDGMAAYLTDGLLAEQPYRVSAKFRCGDKERMIDIYLTQVAKGRDAMKDLTDLMRIAQSRYAEIHNCELNTK